MGEYTEYERFTEYPIFDADQHLYEKDDCFTRHIERKFKDRTLAITRVDGRRILTVDGASHATDDHGGKMARPGSLREMLKAMKLGSADNQE